MSAAEIRKVNGQYSPVYLNTNKEWAVLGFYDTYEEAKAAFDAKMRELYPQKPPPLIAVRRPDGTMSYKQIV